MFQRLAITESNNGQIRRGTRLFSEGVLEIVIIEWSLEGWIGFTWVKRVEDRFERYLRGKISKREGNLR